MNPEQTVKELQDLIALLNRGVSKQEFLDSFKNVIEMVLSLEKDLIGKIGTAFSAQNKEIADALKSLVPLKEEFKKAIEEAKAANETTFAGVRQRAIESIDGLFNKMRLNERVNDIIARCEEQMAKMDEMMSGMPEMDIEQMAREVATLMSEDSAEEERDRLESLKGDERLAMSAIKGLEEELKRIGALKGEIKYVPFGGSSSGSSDTQVRDEIPSGSGTAFTLAHTPTANTLQLFRGGSRISVNNGDYTITGANITLTLALQSEETLTADYSY